MRLRRTAGDLRDLENIVDHLFDQTPQHAPRLMRSIYDSEFNTEGTEARAQRARRKRGKGSLKPAPLHKSKRTDVKIGRYRDEHVSEMAAEFAEAGEDDEFAGAGGDGFVLHVPGVLMRNVDGVEADAKGGIDVAARRIADHPAMGFDDFVFRDEAGVGDSILFVDNFDGFEKALQSGALDFGGLLGGFAFGEENEAMAFGEIGERFGNTVENFWRCAFEVDDAVVNFGKRFAFGEMLGELHVGFFERTAEA